MQVNSVNSKQHLSITVEYSKNIKQITETENKYNKITKEINTLKKYPNLYIYKNILKVALSIAIFVGVIFALNLAAIPLLTIAMHSTGLWLFLPIGATAIICSPLALVARLFFNLNKGKASLEQEAAELEKNLKGLRKESIPIQKKLHEAERQMNQRIDKLLQAADEKTKKEIKDKIAELEKAKKAL